MGASAKLDLKSKLLLALVVVISVFIPVQFWRGVWFGGKLSDGEISAALAENESPRRVQHALTQIEERIRRGDPLARTWHAQIAELTSHPQEEVRVQAAWVMGQDNQSPVFHEALVKLLDDPEPIVQRNAALGLTRFADLRAVPILRAMLRPTVVSARTSGTIRFTVRAGDPVALGEELARIGPDPGAAVSAPIAGRVLELKLEPATTLKGGEPILTLAPDPQHVWEALRALLLIGGSEEIPLVQEILDNPRYSETVREQARLTLKALRDRKREE